MKYLIKILITLLLLEVALGYIYYIRDSTRLTGNYISSTLRVIDRLVLEQIRDIQAQPELEAQAQLELEAQAQLELEAQAQLELEAKAQLELEAKAQLELEAQAQPELEAQAQPELEAQAQKIEISCKDEYKLNREMLIADMNFYRRANKFQTNIDFVNTPDITNKYVIFIVGNSEAYGSSQDIQKRIHTSLQEKIQNKFKSDDFIVLNISDYGFFLHDQFNSVKFFSKIYNPDLVIFYTGGNEINIHNYYEDMARRTNLNIDNEYWYEAMLTGDRAIVEECLDEKEFLKKSNFQVDHASVEIKRYINDGFFEIKKYFDEINSDFMFYIHPFHPESIELWNVDKIAKQNLLKLREIQISDKRFINLSNENFNLDFSDRFHTRDSNMMADKILEDIIITHEQKIISKINSNNN